MTKTLVKQTLTRTLRHFETVHAHRKLVREGCFAVGLYLQGILHDLSKYSPAEFITGARYYQGYRSPNNAEREDKGYSLAWMHHKGINQHHYEWWIDYSATEGVGAAPAKMPRRFLIEMFMDRVAASKTYNGKNYRDDYPLAYFNKGKPHIVMHEQTMRELEFLLTMLAEEGEEKTFSYIRDNVLCGRH